MKLTPWILSMGHTAAPHMRKFFKDPLAGIDIEKEYKLIQEKKSNLSAAQRRLVVARYERDR